ncbi:hypothetical protein ACQY0O_006925 [Thecaphora frezii]
MATSNEETSSSAGSAALASAPEKPSTSSPSPATSQDGAASTQESRKRTKVEDPSTSHPPARPSTSMSTLTPRRPARGPTRPTAGRNSSLFRPFKSPLKQDSSIASSPASASSSAAASVSTSSSTPPRTRAYPSSPTKRFSPGTRLSVRKRTEREELEDRLRVLKQADKVLRDGSLETLPALIQKWREAGRLAAHDLWNLTGAAQAGEESFATSSMPYAEGGARDHRDEVEEVSVPIYGGGGGVRDVTSPPTSPRSRFLLRRAVSDGTREQAAALRGEADEGAAAAEAASSTGSSPRPVSELFASATRRVYGAAGAASLAAGGAKEDADDPPLGEDNAQEADKGIDRKWNVGRMLDLIGVDKSTLRWNADEEDFDT